MFFKVTSLLITTILLTVVAKPTVKKLGDEENDFSYQVFVLNFWKGVYCGGSLLTNRTVLTAAHCVDQLDDIFGIEIVTGTTNLSDVQQNQMLFDSSYITLHPNYNLKNNQNDLALVHLIRPANYNPIELNPNILQARGTGIIAGFGTDSNDPLSISPVLVNFEVPIITNKDCEELLGVKLETNQVCTLGVDGKGPCGVDVGGALVVDDKQVAVLLEGSTDKPLCNNTLPSVYLRVNGYYDWITSIQKYFF